MHSIWTDRDQDFGNKGTLKRGCYVVEDNDAAQLMIMAGGGELEAKPFAISYTLDHLSPQDWNGKTILIVRPGRYGDLILLSPVLREIKRRWPQCQLGVSCAPSYRQALIGLPYVDFFRDYPLPIEFTEDVWLMGLEVLKSYEETAKEAHITDLFAARLGMDPSSIENKAPDFFLSNEERDWAAENYPRLRNNKRIGVHLCASDPVRDYPPKHMMDLLHRLRKEGFDLHIFGLPTEVIGPSFPRARNVAADNLTFRQTAAVVSTCDLLIGPDSSLIHVAAGLRMEVIALYGSFSADLRTRYHPSTFVIESTRGCEIAPCFFAQHGKGRWPVDGPCQKSNRCEALNTINPVEIVSRVQKLIGAATL